MIPSINNEWITVPQFGRINLIVGKNGVGKTRLLRELARLHGFVLHWNEVYPGTSGRLATLHHYFARGPMFFIDGIETGLHHSHARPLWEAIFDSKAEQVFVTTHSRDFVEALAQLAAERPDCGAMIHRIEEDRVVSITTHMLATLSTREFEVR